MTDEEIANRLEERRARLNALAEKNRRQIEQDELEWAERLSELFSSARIGRPMSVAEALRILRAF